MDQTQTHHDSLPDGCMHLTQFLSPAEQEMVWNRVLQDERHFYRAVMVEPGETEARERVPVFCYGTWWDPVKFVYEAPRLALPPELVALADRVHRVHTGRKVRIDTIQVNRLTSSTDSIVMHVDDLEDEAVIDSGSPVLTLSVGQSSITVIGGPRKTDPTRRVVLKSGDGFVLGGASRRHYHGVGGILPKTSSDARTGRIGLTFRQVHA